MLAALESPMSEQRMRVQFSLGSLVSIATLIGFCAGVVCVPLYLIGGMINGGLDLGFVGFTVVVLPLFYGFSMAIMALLSYPAYRYVTNKVGFSYKGIFHEKPPAP